MHNVFKVSVNSQNFKLFAALTAVTVATCDKYRISMRVMHYKSFIIDASYTEILFEKLANVSYCKLLVITDQVRLLNSTFHFEEDNSFYFSIVWFHDPQSHG